MKPKGFKRFKLKLRKQSEFIIFQTKLKGVTIQNKVYMTTF